uniref:Nonstructural RNA-binding protein 1 n=1 Tax=Rotavirus C TaxID=36427 RepID=A0A5Q2V3N4_9REOV|nr:nonstructural RNA-binding protein 1 [Rotavirus C]
MASPFREMLYWFGKIVDRKLPCVNTNGWSKKRGQRNGVCLNCLDECQLYPCDNCGFKHKCGNCIFSECFLDCKNEFNKFRWLSFDEDPDDNTLLQAWIKYKDYFFSKFNYGYSPQSRILDMNKNQKFKVDEGTKKALSVPITTQYLKFKFFGKIHIQFGTIFSTKIQPWLELSETKVGYLQPLNVERCAELMATRSMYACNVVKLCCITKIQCKRPITESDCMVEGYLDKDDNGWKFAAIVGNKKIPVTQKLAMNYFMKASRSELFYYAHSRCHPMSSCPRWNEGLEYYNMSILDIIFKRQFMSEVVEWFELFSQYTGVHYDFITECVHDVTMITAFKKEIDDYITDGKKISLNSVVPEEHAAYKYIIILRNSLMLAIDAALIRIRSQSMGVL